jgi:hypothetical protein
MVFYLSTTGCTKDLRLLVVWVVFLYTNQNSGVLDKIDSCSVKIQLKIWIFKYGHAKSMASTVNCDK